MALTDGQLNRWRERRVQRLGQLSWLRQEARGDGAPVRYVADELLVRGDHQELAHGVLRERGHRVGQVLEESAPAGYRRYRVPNLDVLGAARAIRERAAERGDERVLAGPNHVFAYAPFEQAGPFGPPLPAALQQELLGPASTTVPRVAVLDTGVWEDSPLGKQLYEAEPTDVESDVDVDDDGIRDGDVGHANFITGVIAGHTRNARVRIVRVLDTFGVCTEANLVSALQQIDDDHRIVNLSLGAFSLDDVPPPVLRDAFAALLADGDRLVVAAAGNEGVRDRPYWPAAFADTGEAWSDRVVAVAAHDGTDVCAWSNAGDWVTLAAPGHEVTSTFVRHGEFNSGWAQWSGTSFATPYVVAAIAEELATTASAVDAVAAVVKRAGDHSYSGYPGLP